jgi:gliding motility-associated-like protein
VIDSNGCINADTMVLRFSPIFMATVSGLGASYCISDSAAQLTATPAGGIFLGNVSATGLFTPSLAGAGLHTIKYAFTDSIGCSQFDTVITVVSPLPSIAQAGPDLIGGESLQLAGNTPQVGTGVWSLVGGSGGLLSNPLDPQATISQLAGGTYSLVWTISNPPCPASADTLRITVEGISLPNGFSPNGDGVNDLFVIGGIAAYREAKLSIFNRWGNVVWSAESYANQWDGRSNDGQVLVEDTYYAILSYGSKMTNTFVVLKR